jgi:hypothetical protein
MAKRVSSGTSQKLSNVYSGGLAIVGAFPWLADKYGMTVPVWLIGYSGALAITALAYLIWHILIAWLPGITGSRRQLPVASILAFLAGVASSLWIMFPHTSGSNHRAFTLSKQEVVSKKTFINEKVDIDGKRFERSEFQNVTFIYHGLGKVDFVNSSFRGSIHLHTDNIAVRQFVDLTQLLKSNPGFIGDDISIIDDDGEHYYLRRDQTNKPPEQIR